MADALAYRFSLAVSCLLWLPLQVRAEEAEWLIVPGKSVGKIFIGVDQREVFKLLGTPNMQNDFALTDRKPQNTGRQNREMVAPGEVT